MDLERRAAERAARADPHDPASARALAEALRRSGDRRALFHALCALARAGDAEAAAEVEAWHPWPGPDGRGNRRAGVGRPVRDPVRTRVARLPVGVPRAIAGASSTHLFVVCVPPGSGPLPPPHGEPTVPAERLVAVDLTTLEVAWTVESEVGRMDWERPALLVGEDVAWGTGVDVRVVAARDGSTRRRLPFALDTGEETTDGHLLQAEGDRLALRAQGRRLEVHDLGTGALLWKDRGLRVSRPVAAFDGELLLGDGRSLALADGELTERSRWGELPVLSPLSGLAGHVARLGPGDLIADLRPTDGRLVARVDATETSGWTVQVPGASARAQLIVMGDVVLCDSGSTEGDDWTEVRELRTGVVRWSRARRRADGALLARSSAGVGGDVVLLDAGATRTTLLGFDLAQVPTLDLTLDLPLLVRPPFRDIARVDFAELVALDGALLIVATGDEGDLVIACVENA